ncbi:MAG: RNA 2',3'-cyclic phosphodiesterase [Candidatus Omnitrophica bacterium]|nr:RNA 2',3'-cyclic phosphodiesterase [Candidatus Omnitrophota bacterium]
MNNTIRTFIAIPLDPQIRQTIAQAQNHLKELDCSIKWVDPENIHLTLKFLGEVKLKKIDAVKQALEDLLKSVKPLPIELTQLGAFPDVKRPRIIWVGLNDDTKAISQLVSALEETLGKIGFKKEGWPFSPHITIGRVRSPKNLHLLSESISNYSLPGYLKQTARNITLYKSILTPAGPVYEPLHKTEL